MTKNFIILLISLIFLFSNFLGLNAQNIKVVKAESSNQTLMNNPVVSIAILSSIFLVAIIAFLFVIRSILKKSKEKKNQSTQNDGLLK